VRAVLTIILSRSVAGEKVAQRVAPIERITGGEAKSHVMVVKEVFVASTINTIGRPVEISFAYVWRPPAPERGVSSPGTSGEILLELNAMLSTQHLGFGNSTLHRHIVVEEA
jgi:hypothetical protein